MCIVQLVDYIALALETTGERIITAEAQNSSGIDMHQNTDALFLGDLRGTTRLRKPTIPVVANAWKTQLCAEFCVSPG